MQLEQFEWQNVHENLLKLIQNRLSWILNDHFKGTHLSPDLQSETISFTLLCLKHYLFFEAARLVAESPDEKRNVSKLIEANPSMLAIYGSLQQLAVEFWPSMRGAVGKLGTELSMKYMILFEFCQKHQISL